MGWEGTGEVYGERLGTVWLGRVGLGMDGNGRSGGEGWLHKRIFKISPFSLQLGRFSSLTHKFGDGSEGVSRRGSVVPGFVAVFSHVRVFLHTHYVETTKKTRLDDIRSWGNSRGETKMFWV